MVPHCPLWDWAVDLILDQRLAPYFEWDVRKIFKHEGGHVTRVYTELWISDAFWNFQVHFYFPFCSCKLYLCFR